MSVEASREPVDSADDREKTYHSISEVAELLDVRPHVLRYWETQFPMLRPRKGRSGSRMYREREVEMARRIRTLLYEKGFTIRGARHRLKLEQRKDGGGEGQLGLGIENPHADALGEIRDELTAILQSLRSRGKRG
jgi:DNA-binding transcriptional MerR regulator